MQRGEVWWVEFDPSVGSEIKKTRPAVIISNNAANKHLARVVVIPITSNVARTYPGEALIMLQNTPGKAMIDQIMAADKARLKSKIDKLSVENLIAIEEAIKQHFDLTF